MDKFHIFPCNAEVFNHVLSAFNFVGTVPLGTKFCTKVFSVRATMHAKFSYGAYICFPISLSFIFGNNWQTPILNANITQISFLSSFFSDGIFLKHWLLFKINSIEDSIFFSHSYIIIIFTKQVVNVTFVYFSNVNIPNYLDQIGVN